MSFWSNLFGSTPNDAGETPNANPSSSVGPPGYSPGDPDGLELVGGEDVENRSSPWVMPSPWSGWPSEWSTPNWSSGLGIQKLVDTAWACLDLNASVLSTMPAYRLTNGQVVQPRTWMINPDPLIYNSWQEFLKQLFWDYQMGEAFVLPMATGSDNYPLKFRVIPPWLVNVEMLAGKREYHVGSLDVTDEILHIRYQSNTAYARGIGPLEVAGARITAAGLLQRYANKIAETGGVPLYWLDVDRRMNQAEANDLLDRWVESRIRRAGEPALVTGGAKLNEGQSMSARDMTLLELAQFNESRIAVLLGVPPFLVGLPGGGDSLTYSNVAQLFDFHDRASLRPKAVSVMSALSGWALPAGQTIELNREEYSRPGLLERAQAYEILVEMGALTAQDVAAMERFGGEGQPAPAAAVSLTGGNG